jgi:hypothetical protein
MYFEWRGQVNDNVNSVAQIGFLQGLVLALATWNGTLQQWSVTTGNGIDPAQTTVLAATIGPATPDLRWEIVVSANQTVYRVNGETVAVHTIDMTDVPCAIVRGVTLADAELCEVTTDQILVYQPGLVRD